MRDLMHTLLDAIVTYAAPNLRRRTFLLWYVVAQIAAVGLFAIFGAEKKWLVMMSIALSAVLLLMWWIACIGFLRSQLSPEQYQLQPNLKRAATRVVLIMWLWLTLVLSTASTAPFAFVIAVGLLIATFSIAPRRAREWAILSITGGLYVYVLIHLFTKFTGEAQKFAWFTLEAGLISTALLLGVTAMLRVSLMRTLITLLLVLAVLLALVAAILAIGVTIIDQLIPLAEIPEPIKFYQLPMALPVLAIMGYLLMAWLLPKNPNTVIDRFSRHHLYIEEISLESKRIMRFSIWLSTRFMSPYEWLMARAVKRGGFAELLPFALGQGFHWSSVWIWVLMISTLMMSAVFAHMNMKYEVAYASLFSPSSQFVLLFIGVLPIMFVFQSRKVLHMLTPAHHQLSLTPIWKTSPQQNKILWMSLVRLAFAQWVTSLILIAVLALIISHDFARYIQGIILVTCIVGFALAALINSLRSSSAKPPQLPSRWLFICALPFITQYLHGAWNLSDRFKLMDRFKETSELSTKLLLLAQHEVIVRMARIEDWIPYFVLLGVMLMVVTWQSLLLLRAPEPALPLKLAGERDN
jgi:hypothetical protein